MVFADMTAATQFIDARVSRHIGTYSDAVAIVRLIGVDPRRRLTNNVAISPVPRRTPAAAGCVCMSRCWPSCMPPAC
jgi:hypothetical protein